jgi:hypothetical protein
MEIPFFADTKLWRACQRFPIGLVIAVQTSSLGFTGSAARTQTKMTLIVSEEKTLVALAFIQFGQT